MTKVTSKKYQLLLSLLNKFNHKNKISKFRYNDIKDFIDNINKNTFSEISAKKT